MDGQVLTRQQVIQLLQEHERKVNKPPHGYPVKMITDLFSRLLFVEKEKSKYKALARKRGEVLTKIHYLSEINKLTEEEVNDRLGDTETVPSGGAQDSNLSQKA